MAEPNCIAAKCRSLFSRSIHWRWLAESSRRVTTLKCFMRNIRKKWKPFMQK
uniref:Uncharacterized protein n=1 Tax=Arundo donax TaxID=35708 RepID=A0A0A9CCL1_ARUDO